VGPLIAQAADAATKAAEGTVPVLERILAGGVPLICLSLAVVFGVVAVWLFRRNHQLSEAAVTREKELANERVSEQGALLREMLERDREAQEAQQAATTAVESFTTAIQDLREEVKEMRREIRDL